MVKTATFLAAICLASVALASDEPVPKELLGIWKLESTSFKGALPSKPDGVVWLIILNNGDFVLKSANDLQGGTVVIDATTTPPGIDFHMKLKSGSDRKWTNLGIYKVKDDVITTAKAPEGKNRPTSFKPSADSVVQVFRRSPD